MIFPKKSLTIILVIVVIAVAAFFMFFNKTKEKPADKSSETPGSSTPAQQAQAQKFEAAPLPVKVATAKKADLVIRLKSPGEAVTERKIAIKAEVSGIIKKLHAAEGKHVKEGELLAEIDDQEYKLKLERQEALRLRALSELFLEKQFAEPEKQLDSRTLERINTAKEEFEKASSLYTKGLITKEDYEKAKRDYEIILIETGRKKEEIMASSKQLTQFEIDVKIAQMQLDKTRIRAPFAGIITDIKVSPRENVDVGRELYTLVNISQIKVQAKVLESEVGKMKVGREVALRFSAYPEKTFKGTVEAISPVINPEDKTCKVFISVSNPQEEIKPGMHAEVEIAADIYKDRLLIPQEAVLVRGGRKLAFVVEGGLAKWRYIEVGLENEQCAEVLDGVKEGELIITEGHFTLAHDTRVQITKENE